MEKPTTLGRELVVGVGVRSYNATYSYAGLPVPATSFIRAWRAPLNRLRPSSQAALNTYVPLDPRVDLLHLMNGVVATGLRRPWVASFESTIPRLGEEPSRSLESFLVKRLLGSDCRGLLAWSSTAFDVLAEEHPPEIARRLQEKTQIFTGSTGPAVASPPEHELPLRVLFVGTSLVAKGGVAFLRAVTRARAAGVPIEATVVGDPELPTDVLTPWERYRDEALGLLPCSRWLRRADQAEVSALMAENHVLVFPSLRETLGWVTLEAMQRGLVPVVAGIGVQRGLIGAAGIALEIPLCAHGRWNGLRLRGRDRELASEEVLAAMTDQIVAALTELALDRGCYERESAKALAEYSARFDPVEAGARLRAIYDHALQG